MSALSTMMLTSKQRRRNAFLAIITFVGITLFMSLNFTQRRMLLIEDYKRNFEFSGVSWLRPVSDADTPVFWHIPKSGGTSMKRYYSCMGLSTATQYGVNDGHENDETIDVWDDELGNKHVNVDTSTREGLVRAGELGLAESGLADVVFASYVADAIDIFNPTNKGAFFTLMRHPIERIVSQFYFDQIAYWQRGGYRPDLKKVKLEAWLSEQLTKCAGNFMTKLLIGKYGDACHVTEEEFQLAKDVLRRKFTVGLLSNIEESVDRFDKRFGWYDHKKRQQCYDMHVKVGDNKNPHDEVKEGSEAWNLLVEMNYYDLQLYDYAVRLFDRQGDEYHNRGTY